MHLLPVFKQQNRTTNIKKDLKDLRKDQDINKETLFPGKRVNVKPHQSAVPGRMRSSRGIYDLKDMYYGGSIILVNSFICMSVKNHV